MSVLFANRFKTTLSAGVLAGATVLPLSSTTNLPAIGGGNYCYLTLISADQLTIEVVKATAVAGGNVTVTRAQEGTAAVAWSTGDAVELRLTTQSLLDALAERLGINATADAALKLATPRAFTITGDIDWTVNFDGTADESAAGTIAAKAVTNAKLADMTIAGLKGALAAGATTDLSVANIRTLLSITNVENKDSATIRGELTSANVTTALGFTPQVAGSYQAADGTLTALAGLSWAAGVQIPSFTAADTVSLLTVGSAAGNILDKTAGDSLYAPKTPAALGVASSATVTPDFQYDQVNITAQAVALTLANPTGTAISSKRMVIRIKDNGTARTIAYGTQYRAIGVTLPTTTVAGKTLYLGMIYNLTDTKWDVVAVGQE